MQTEVGSPIRAFSASRPAIPVAISYHVRDVHPDNEGLLSGGRGDQLTCFAPFVVLVIILMIPR